jgi:hypothetical protein
MPRFIYAVPAVVGELIFDPLQYFSWWIYAAVGAVYTVIEFGGELLGNEIFSKRNAKPLSAIFTIHLAFLTILLVLMRVAVFISPALPDWLTDAHHFRGSPLDGFFILAMVVMLKIEQRLIYVESDTDDPSDPGNHSSQSSAIRK